LSYLHLTLDGVVSCLMPVARKGGPARLEGRPERSRERVVREPGASPGLPRSGEWERRSHDGTGHPAWEAAAG